MIDWLVAGVSHSFAIHAWIGSSIFTAFTTCGFSHHGIAYFENKTKKTFDVVEIIEMNRNEKKWNGMASKRKLRSKP